MKCVISVLGKDRSGIVAAIATALADCGANIDDISQTILDDIFSMTMLTTLDTEKADFNTVQERLAKISDDLGMQIIIQREDVFQYMYKIEGKAVQHDVCHRLQASCPLPARQTGETMRTLGGYRPLDSAFERIATPAPLLNEQQAGMLSNSSYSGYPLIK